MEDALSNRKPIARGEQHRGAVVAIQSALSDLNRGYLLAAEIDGYYGSRTYSAVEAFQRDYGLAADGIVGRQTMTQLDSLYSGDVYRKSRGMSVHVGVDKVDPAHYGADFALSSCVNDAHKMREIAESIGYEAVTYENENATVSNFTAFMRSAISNLIDGDSLLVTFSGHGSQLPNNSPDSEDDNLDETLCFYDRMFVDDEFYALLGQFREGVRVHGVFDSCHSGTIAKDLVQVDTERADYQQKALDLLQGKVPSADREGAPKKEDVTPISAKGITEAMDGNKPESAKPPQPTKEKEANDDIASLFADLDAEKKTIDQNVKQIGVSDFPRIYEANKKIYMMP